MIKLVLKDVWAGDGGMDTKIAILEQQHIMCGILLGQNDCDEGK